eukprot:5614169-Amphidinium_carterae.1
MRVPTLAQELFQPRPATHLGGVLCITAFSCSGSRPAQVKPTEYANSSVQYCGDQSYYIQNALVHDNALDANHYASPAGGVSDEPASVGIACSAQTFQRPKPTEPDSFGFRFASSLAALPFSLDQLLCQPVWGIAKH